MRLSFIDMPRVFCVHSGVVGKAKEGAVHLLNDVSAYRCRILDGPRYSV
jgi:hypothetical protein